MFAKLLDYVPGSLPKENSLAKLCILEDNEPVLKMAVKQRWPALRYVARTQRIDLDWLFERIAYDPGIMIRYVNTKLQLADILTKGCFTAQQFNALTKSKMIGPILKATNKDEPKKPTKPLPKGKVYYVGNARSTNRKKLF